ncbi:MAG: zf-HC2 domain-containing protein, partial [Verrucomicrobiota bacterium]
MNAECRHCSDAAAFLADELSPRERADFQLHLVQCAECREAVESTRNLLGRLLAVPRAEPTRDLASGVLARLHEPVVKMPRRPTWTHIAAAAAAIAVLGAGLLMRDVTRGNLSPSSQVAVDTAANTDRALDWFVRAQEQDGSWNAERWGGLSNYAPALTALPMLALLNADDITPERETAATRAAANLLALQNADGSFGPVFHGSPYNHSITTFALLHAWQRRPDIVPKAALDAALAALAAR